MKKPLYLLLLIAAPLAAQAQSITLTQSDAPQAGEVWMELGDNRYGMHQITSSGPGQTWDYSAAFQVDDTTITSFVPVGSVPQSYSANFPGATLASYSPGDTMAVFFKTNSTGFYVDGTATDPQTIQGITVSYLPFNPDLLVMPVPFTYGDTRTHVAKMVVEGSMSGAQFRLVLTSNQSFEADAYGSITTPSGVYSNTLRVKETRVTQDSAYANFGFGWQPIPGSNQPETTISYTWLKNGPASRIMYLEEDANAPGNSVFASYQGQVLISAPGQIAAAAPAHVYPNPATNQPVTFDIAEANATRLVITDMLGREVKTEDVSGLNRLVLATNRLGAGTYLYSLLDKNGNRLDAGRFVVAK